MVRMQADGRTLDVKIVSNNWSASTWYFIATSWALNGTVSLYCRPLSPTGTASYAASTMVLTNGTGYGGQMYVGERQAGSDDANGSIALVRIYKDEYQTSQSDFDALYNGLMIPEPGSLTLLGIGGLAVLLRQFRRRGAQG